MTVQEVPDLKIINGRPTICFSLDYVIKRRADFEDILHDLLITRRIKDLHIEIGDI